MPQTKIPATHLELGTLIDGNSLELVEVLGIGGYGVVYRAVETCSPNPMSYAVKCLLHSHVQPAARRQFHIREIALHQISSAHPGVVTLHRVIEDCDYTYIIMDYAPDHDLFTQILSNRRYVGDDSLIKHVFLQLLDAVEYCHSLGIYHRDLKPENVLCFDDGCRVAITDFGLATTEKLSEELRTGSIYHMSPECQGGEFAPNGTYSPMSNDVWSLGIILLNLATGRNPWKTATPDDPTFQAYLHNPMEFFPSVLPISMEINEVLVRMLHIDWRERLTLAELREMMENINNFYSDDVIFEGSMARCPWEAGLEIDGDPHNGEGYGEARSEGLKSYWSDDSMLNSHTSDSPIAELSHGLPWSMPGATSAFQSTASIYASQDSAGIAIQGEEPSSHSYIPHPDTHLTPSISHEVFRTLRPAKDLGDIFDQPRQPLYQAASQSSSGSSMELAIEEDVYSPSIFLESPPTSLEESSSCKSINLDGTSARGTQNVPSAWAYSQSRTSSTSSDHSSLSGDISFSRPTIPRPDWTHSPVPPPGMAIYPSRRDHEGKGHFFNSFNIFARGTHCSAASRKISDNPHIHDQPALPQPAQTWFGPFGGAPAPVFREAEQDRSHTKPSHFASTRHWFLPGKLFTSSVAS